MTARSHISLTRFELVCLLLAAAGAVLVWQMPTTTATLAALAALFFPCRGLWRAWRSDHARPERVLVIGNGRLAAEILSALERQPERAEVIGILGEWQPPGRNRYPVLGRVSQIHRAVKRGRPDRIIVAADERRGQLPVRQLLRQRMRGVRVEEGVSAYERLTGKVPIERLAPGTLLFAPGFSNSRLDGLASRLLSIAAALAGLLVLLPLLGIIAAAIKIDSNGPVFFVQRRLGLRGRAFALVKFRTMQVGGTGSEWVRDNRHRITRVGELLRRFRLDELPQFFNILRGDMNLVGPRPHPVANAQLFARKIPYYWLRARVRPGATGWAQVRYGYANSLDEETEKMRYDLYYIKHRSFWLDLKIIPATVRAVLSGGGAATAHPPATVLPLRRSRKLHPAAAGLGVPSRRDGLLRRPRRPSQRYDDSNRLHDR